MKDFFILAKWIFGAFVGGVLVSFVETRSFSYKAMLDSLDFFIYIIPIIVAYYFYNKLRWDIKVKDLLIIFKMTVGATYINNTEAIITRNLNNAIENTGTKKFGLGVVGGGVGELVVESRSYSEGKKDITPTNLIGTANNILKSGLTGGITANTNTAQSLGINVFSSVTLKGTNTTDSLKESSISSTISIIGGKYNIPEPYSGLYNSYTTEYIKGILKKYEENKEVK